jgi:hypothetical protein
MDKQQESEIQTAHQNWLKHPVTKAALDRLEAHRERFIILLSQDSSNENVTDAAYRHYGVGLRTCDAALKLLEEPVSIIIKPNQLSDL